MNEPTMDPIAEVVAAQLGSANPSGGEFDPASLVRFSPHVRERLEPSESARLREEAESLAPWLQGPFYLGGDLVVGGSWRIDSHWVALGPEVPESLAGQRVLDIGSNAGYDPFSFSLRGPEQVVACEPFAFIEQARFLERVYRTGVEFRQVGWQHLDPDVDGRFDLVHCRGVLYHECDPVGLVERLFEMTAPGGLLLFGSIMHADPLHAGLCRLVPGSYFSDPTWWWVPGHLAVRRLLEDAGFAYERSFGRSPGPEGEFATINGYFRARRPA